jgi:hypothetical protein
MHFEDQRHRDVLRQLANGKIAFEGDPTMTLSCLRSYSPLGDAHGPERPVPLQALRVFVLPPTGDTFYGHTRPEHHRALLRPYLRLGK